MRTITSVGLKKAVNPKGLSTKSEAQKRFEEINRIVRQSWWELGQRLREGMERKDWQAMGFKNVREWLDAATYGSISSAWKALRIAKALEHVPESTMRRLTEAKADKLASLPKEEREKSEWLTMAADPRVSTQDFRGKVASFFESKGVKREPMADFYLRMPQAALENIFEPAEKKVARLLNVDLERFPNKRLEIWERIAVFVLTTEEEHFMVELEGSVSPTLEQASPERVKP